MEAHEIGPLNPLNPPGQASPAHAFDADALTRALRIAGAVLVVASASTFMLQRWDSGNDLLRYAMLVGQSVLLALAAYFVGLTVREGRSARTFLALVLATIPASFAVLGGLVYSQFHLEALAVLPSFVSWVAPSKASAVIAVAGTLLVLLPLTFVSFVALARKEAKALTAIFCAANLLVLIPARHPEVALVIAGVALLGALRLDLTRFVRVAQLDTIEGKLARCMPFVPPVIIVGRVISLYHVGLPFAGGLLMIAGAMLWLFLSGMAATWKRDLGAWCSALLAIAGWVLCFGEISPLLESQSVSVLLLGLPISALLFLASHRAESSRRGLVDASTVFALLTTLVASAFDHGMAAAFACISIGVGVAVWGAATRARLRTLSGGFVAVWGLVLQVWLAAHADSWYRWLSLSAVGILLIVGSAFVEKHRVRIGQIWTRAAQRPIEHDA